MQFWTWRRTDMFNLEYNNAVFGYNYGPAPAQYFLLLSVPPQKKN